MAYKYMLESNTSLSVMNVKLSLSKHRQSKLILTNIDPVSSPDSSKNVVTKKDDEGCLAVINLAGRSFALIHCDECWSRRGHSFSDLAPKQRCPPLGHELCHPR